MEIEQLYLKSFRSYKKALIPLHPRLTIFYGSNAVGKTNILEAISILSTGKSFRGGLDKDIVKNYDNGYYIACKFKKNNKNYKLSYAFQIKNKKNNYKAKLNNKVIKGRQFIIGQIISVIFSPSDIMIVDGSPLYRRRFIDAILSYQSKNYLHNIISYNQTLRQRNAVIKNIKNNKSVEKSLELWDYTLEKYASFVIKKRIQFITDFNVIFSEVIYNISKARDKIEIDISLSHPQEKKDYLKVLQSNYRKDISLGYTFYGPHRQDLIFKENGKECLSYFSQGQKRSLVLGMRLAQFYFLKKILNLSPLLIIDDVFGDLDDNRRASFVKLLEKCGQAIIATPNLEDLNFEKLNIRGENFKYKIPSIFSEPILI